MAESNSNISLAIALQPVADTFVTPTQPDDLLLHSNCRLQIDGVTITNDEYTGSPIKNGDDVVGKRVTLSYTLKLRPPGGGSVPLANTFLLGRVLQACKLTEVRNAAAIPVAPEALGVGSTTTMAKLGATAAAVANTYKAFPLILSDNGATYKKQLTAVRSYSATKEAGLVEQLTAPPAANYQIPPFIGYFRSITPTNPSLISHSLWWGGDRYDLMNGTISSWQMQVPTSTTNTPAYPELTVSWDVDLYVTAEEAAPAVPVGGTIPFYKDGDGILANKAIGMSTFSLDLGIQSESPPNPNKASGEDAAQLTSSTARLSITKQKYRKSVFDGIAFADAQAQHAFYAAWGYGAAGTVVQVIVPDARFNYPNSDTSGPFANESQDLMIDAFDRGVAIVFPY